MKDFTLSSSKSNKRLLSLLSPTEDQHTKKLKQLDTKIKGGKNKDKMDTAVIGSNNGTESGKIDVEMCNGHSCENIEGNMKNSNLEGALGPLV